MYASVLLLGNIHCQCLSVVSDGIRVVSDGISDQLDILKHIIKVRHRTLKISLLSVSVKKPADFLLGEAKIVFAV